MSQVKKERPPTRRGRPPTGQVTLVGTRTSPKGEILQGEIVEFTLDPTRMEKVLGATTAFRRGWAEGFYGRPQRTRAHVEQDRIRSLMPVLARAIEVFGNSDKATRWMQRPNRALGQKTPIEMLGAKEGRKEVEELLGRIEYGVYS